MKIQVTYHIVFSIITLPFTISCYRSFCTHNPFPGLAENMLFRYSLHFNKNYFSVLPVENDHKEVYPTMAIMWLWKSLSHLRFEERKKDTYIPSFPPQQHSRLRMTAVGTETPVSLINNFGRSCPPISFTEC